MSREAPDSSGRRGRRLGVVGTVVDLQTLHRVPGSAFEVVDARSLRR